MAQEDGLSLAPETPLLTRPAGSFSLDVAGAYPEEAGMKSWIRRFSQRGEEVLVEEDFMLDRPRQPVLHLICLEKPELEKGKMLFSQLGVQALLSEPFQIQIQEILLEDQKLIDAWESTRVYRLTLSLKEKVRQGRWKMRIQRMN